MNKVGKSSYLESFKEYQDKQYLPGYYVGGKIPLDLKAQTKAGGYFMLIVGIITLPFYLTLFLKDLSFGNLGGIVPICVSVLLVIVGFRFIKLNTKKKK